MPNPEIDMQYNTLQQNILRLIAGPEHPQKDYIINNHTYTDIYQLAAGFRHSLKNSRSPVCICTENKALIMAAIIAALSSGISLVFPFAFSKMVLNETRETTGFTAMISDKQDMSLEGIKLIPLQKKDNEPFQLTKNLDDTFITLFTGGSTGKPKIWTKTLRNIFTEAIYLKDTYHINNDDIFIATVPPYHIYGLLFSVIVPFISSSSVLPDVYVFPQEIVSELMNHAATIFISVPMHYRTIRNTEFTEHSLRLAFSSAGALDKDDGHAFYTNTKTAIYEIYGSTETGGIATRCRAKGEEALTVFDNLSWKISDERLLVKSQFISPELQLDEDGFFTTGDRAQKIDTKSFILLGRADGIVKVAGKRVDLAYIQHKLKTIASITDVYITSTPVKHGRENEIVALVEGNIEEKKIRIEAQKLLEPYAIPKKIKIVKKIPLSKTGKYDKKAIDALFNR